jgi:dihydroorotate dehydrogenase (fumarate)
MDLSTTYMGLKLKNPLIVSSSKLTGNYNDIKLCIEHGAAAIVLKSIFEEQIMLESESIARKNHDNAYEWFPEAKEFIKKLSTDEYLDTYLKFIGKMKKDFKVPVISSINCVTPDIWPVFAKKIEAAGADALELNISIFPFDTKKSGDEIEDLYVQILSEVKNQVSIPVSVKLGHYFTNIYSISNRLVQAGADGLVLFNRYSRRNIDIDTAKIIPDNYISSVDEMSIPLRWIALLSGHKIGCDLAASTGVHNYQGIIKQTMAGANAVQLCSTLYLNGINYIELILKDIEIWMKQKKIHNLSSVRGKVVETKAADYSFEHLQFMKRNFD